MKYSTTLLAMVGAASAARVAKNHCCTLYSEKNMQGLSQQYCIDGSRTFKQLFAAKDQDGNLERKEGTVYRPMDSYIEWDAKSYSCPQNTSLVVCDEDDDEAMCEQKANWSMFYSWTTGGSNTDISGVDLSHFAILADQVDVILYESSDCTGESVGAPYAGFEYTHPSKDRSLYEEGHKLMGAGQTRYDPSELASMRVPYGFNVNLYANKEDGAQAFQTIHGKDDTCFTFRSGQLEKLSIEEDEDPLRTATGEWVKLAQTSQGVEYTYSSGLTSTDTEMNRKSMNMELSYSMQGGVNLGIASLETTMSASMAYKTAQEITQSFSNDINQEYVISCQPDQGDETYGASIYQWVVGNGIVTAKSQTTLCVTGENWNSPPQCPPTTCIDRQCQECTEWQQ